MINLWSGTGGVFFFRLRNLMLFPGTEFRAELGNWSKIFSSNLVCNYVIEKWVCQTSLCFYSSFQLVPSYTLLVEVRDMAGQPFGLCTTGTAVIRIEDMNDNAPCFKQMQVSLLKCLLKRGGEKTTSQKKPVFITFLVSWRVVPQWSLTPWDS